MVKQFLRTNDVIYSYFTYKKAENVKQLDLDHTKCAVQRPHTLFGGNYVVYIGDYSLQVYNRKQDTCTHTHTKRRIKWIIRAQNECTLSKGNPLINGENKMSIQANIGEESIENWMEEWRGSVKYGTSSHYKIVLRLSKETALLNPNCQLINLFEY